MELVYSIDTLQRQFMKDWVSEERNSISLSCRNILALSKYAENPQTPCSQFDHRYDIVVIDLDKPWQPHIVTTVNNQLVHILWDATGSKLLIIDTDGMCQVWAMKDHLLNQWLCVGSVSTIGEEVVSVMWFHNGLQMIFDVDKREKTQYMDKFVRNTKFLPSMTQLGGSFVEGFIMVTASGLVTVGVKLDGVLVSASESLYQNHVRITAADIANTGNGDIMVATSDGQLSSAIQCFLVSVNLNGKNIIITCQNSASLYMKTQMDYGNRESHAMRITKVMFMNEDSSDTLFVCCGSTNYNCLEIWQLLEQMMPLHKMFSLNSTVQDTTNKTHKWMHKATIPHPSQLTCIARPKLPMSRNVVETTNFLPYIATSYKDGTIQLIHRYTFQVISTSNIDALCQQVQSTLSTGCEKKQKMSLQLSAMTQTGSGCGIVGQHEGHVYLFRTSKASCDSTMLLTPSSIVLLLEYAMVTGHDWWDVFLAVRQGMIMTITQSLTDNYNKQLHTMQDYVLMRLLSMKMGLFSSFSGGHQKAVDYHCQLVLQSIGNVIKGILKIEHVTSQDKSPAEKITLLCTKHTDGEIDTIMSKIDTDEFLIDVGKKDKPDASLVSIQPLIQWVSDLCIQLLSAAPMFQSYSSFCGSSLLVEPSVLLLLRELLVIFKIWGILCPSCLPSFTTTSINLDIIKHLFKLLTKAWVCCKEGRSIEFDEILLDECSVLPSKVIIPSISQSFRMDNNGFTVFTQTLPLVFKFGEEPDYVYQKRIAKSQRSVAEPVSNRQQHDIVRQIHLGIKVSEDTRQCKRCGCKSLLKLIGKSQLMQSWEQRWSRNCLCMGHWTLLD